MNVCSSGTADRAEENDVGGDRKADDDDDDDDDGIGTDEREAGAPGVAGCEDAELEARGTRGSRNKASNFFGVGVSSGLATFAKSVTWDCTFDTHTSSRNCARLLEEAKVRLLQPRASGENRKG